MIKVDFHVGEAITGELNRSQTEEILSGVVVPIVSKEDAILSKLIWIHKGSHKSRHDVKSMLRRMRSINEDYLLTQAVHLGVHTILAELRAELNDE